MGNSSSSRPIIIWLFLGCFLVFSMVVVGGMTRLTHSGLSMVEWDLFMGAVPPMNQGDWEELFGKYQQYPEFQELNYDFTVEDFKSIFWWEYIHRMLGRFIGMVFLIPFLFFWWKKMLDRKLLTKLLIILGLGAFQAFLGWIMVKSGLVKEPRVSHFRLAAHLITAFLTCAYIFWVALDLIYKNRPPNLPKGSKLPETVKWLFGLVVIQIIYGAFVAGLRAGEVHNTFPMMNGEWIHSAVTAMDPVWLNFVEGLSGVQFVHRYIAYFVVGIVIYLWWRSRKSGLEIDQLKGVNALLIAVGIQFLLGVFTLLYHVPITLGVLHQLGALVLLMAVVFVRHRFRIARA